MYTFTREIVTVNAGWAKIAFFDTAFGYGRIRAGMIQQVASAAALFPFTAGTTIIPTALQKASANRFLA